MLGPGEAFMDGMIVLASLLATRLGPMGDALGAALRRLAPRKQPPAKK